MTPCIEVTGYKFSLGYVRKKYQGKRQYAHRIAWQRAFGPIPAGLKVLHKCDNPACINPEHLFLGTHQDNMDDMASKGRARRQPRGSGNVNARLTEETVVAIMARLLTKAETQQRIADELGVSKHTINDIWHGRSWSHLFK